MQRRIIGILLTLLCFLAALPGPAVLAAELPPQEVQYDWLVENDPRERGSSAPGAATVAALPYAASADIANEVYTNKCVKPSSTSLKLEFEGSVNGDTQGKASVQIWLYNARTGRHVATRTLSQGRSFNLNTTVTQLNSGDPYYLRIFLTEKTSTETRVSFTLWLKNA